jgi:hypothetical protein
MHGVPAERRHERCQLPRTGAQRASRHRPFRLIGLALMATVLAVGGGRTQPPDAPRPARRSSSSSARRIADRELHLERQEIAAQARSTARPSTRSTARTRPGPASAASSQGANLFDLPRPRQRLAQPVRPFQREHEGRPRPQRDRRQLDAQVLRRVLRRPLPELRAQRGRDPQPAVLRVGQLRVGQRLSDEVDRDQAGRQLRGRLPPDGRRAVFAEGVQQRVLHRLGGSSRRRRRCSEIFYMDPARDMRWDFSFQSSRTPGRVGSSTRTTARTTTTGR